MGHQHERRAPLPVQLLHQLDDRLAGGCIEVAGRFVGEQNSGAVYERPGERHPLLLASREVGGGVVEPIPQADSRQQRGEPVGHEFRRRCGDDVGVVVEVDQQPLVILVHPQREVGQCAVVRQDEVVAAHITPLADLAAPDLFIRTGGELRVSNFLLWQLAYTELWFTETLWPDLDGGVLQQALDDFAARERRFGLTGEQLACAVPADTMAP